MDADDFYLDDDELGEDNQLTNVDLAKLKIVESIIKTANDIKTNLRFNEQSDCSSNIAILSSMISNLIELDSEEICNLSEEELQEKLEEVQRKTTELTFANIDRVVPDQNDEETEDGSEEDDDDDTSGGTDF